MTSNIHNYTESLMNPAGRFKTLGGIYPVTDPSGEPHIILTENTADFETIYNGERHTLRCLIRCSEEQRSRLKGISSFTINIDTGFLIPHALYENEMLVYDNFDNPHYTDVILHRKPDGERLDRFIASAAGNGDAGTLAEVLKGIGNLARWLSENGFSHGAAGYGKIVITPSLTPVLVDYMKSERKPPSGDLLALSSIAVVIGILAREPGLYHRICNEKTLSVNGLKDLMTHLYRAFRQEPESPLKELVETAAMPSCGITGNDICDKIEALAGAGEFACSPLAGMLPHCEKPTGAVKKKERHSSGKGRKRFSFIGGMCETVMRAFDGRHWHYIDKDGKTVISGGFIYAGDFSEGRAVVETEGGHGLIDRTGKYVIEPRFDDIEWSSVNNTAIVTLEGLSGLYSRYGEPLTGLLYDQILLPAGESELFPVRREGRFGYIDRKGTEVIGLIYDDAFAFSNGYARVRKGDRTLLIDTSGNLIDEVADSSQRFQI